MLQMASEKRVPVLESAEQIDGKLCPHDGKEISMPTRDKRRTDAFRELGLFVLEIALFLALVRFGKQWIPLLETNGGAMQGCGSGIVIICAFASTGTVGSIIRQLVGSKGVDIFRATIISFRESLAALGKTILGE